ncbi:hypothetical protein GMDG_01901 [Pseudogymnoascus destructans 20631-21]|uniref:Cytochrome b561 domain-containing protein n=1 Tax=Pseudogymnoascus destructans (strain ATCC MYA-4855 / 20631-21) TaxID=658429 RepID=L8FZ53_PSED2|nr:hypothetical protein GMDG_01901 [Pseudogymnoascus destructans 20631-21]
MRTQEVTSVLIPDNISLSYFHWILRTFKIELTSLIMIRLHRLALVTLILAFTPEIVFGQEVHGQGAHDQLNARDVHQKRNLDSFKTFNRNRNAHALIMSIVFIILYPLGAISVHLPIDRVPYLKNTYLKKRVMAMHVPIQVLGSVMMVGGMALGIRIGQDLGYLRRPVHAHVVIGFVVVCTIIVFQPIMGILAHRHFKKRGDKSIFAYLHRWIGRAAIILGMINSGLGFQLAQTNVIVSTGAYIRNYVLLGFLCLSGLVSSCTTSLRCTGRGTGRGSSQVESERMQ